MGTTRQAGLHADVLLLALHWSSVDPLLKQADDLVGKVILTLLRTPSHA